MTALRKVSTHVESPHVAAPTRKDLAMNKDDVINKEFPHSLFGYDPVSVDSFLDEVIREFDRLNNTIDLLNFRLRNELEGVARQNDYLALQLEYARTGRRMLDAVAGRPGETELPQKPKDEPNPSGAVSTEKPAEEPADVTTAESKASVETNETME